MIDHETPRIKHEPTKEFILNNDSLELEIRLSSIMMQVINLLRSIFINQVHFLHQYLLNQEVKLVITQIDEGLVHISKEINDSKNLATTWKIIIKPLSYIPWKIVFIANATLIMISTINHSI